MRVTRTNIEREKKKKRRKIYVRLNSTYFHNESLKIEKMKGSLYFQKVRERVEQELSSRGKILGVL